MADQEPQVPAEPAPAEPAPAPTAEETAKTTMSSMFNGISAAVSAGIAHAQSVDEKYQISNTAKAKSAEAVAHAQAMDEKYQISAQAKEGAAKAVAKVQELDEKHQVTNQTKAAAKKAATMVKDGAVKAHGHAVALDDKYQVSATVKAHATAVDEKLGVSARTSVLLGAGRAKVSQIDLQYGVSDRARATIGAVQNVVYGADVFFDEANLLDGDEITPCEVHVAYGETRQNATISINIPENPICIELTADTICSAEETVVTLGTAESAHVLQFAAQDAADSFVAAIMSIEIRMENPELELAPEAENGGDACE